MEGAPHQRAGLLSLATELLLIIIDHLDAPPDLRNLSATCSRLHELIEPRIWRSLAVLKGQDARRIAKALHRKLTRTSFVQELVISYQRASSQTLDEDVIAVLDPCIHRMHKLRHLTLESPCISSLSDYEIENLWSDHQFSKIDYTRLFEDAINEDLPTRPLEMLQSVTLHSHKSQVEPFSFGRAGAIFFHPTIRKITVSCADMEFSELKLAHIPPEKLKSTALQSLTFSECNVYLDCLEVILNLPKALKELSVGERLYAESSCLPDSRRRTTTDLDFIDVLQTVSHSLERLTHNSGSREIQDPAVHERNQVSASSVVDLQNKGKAFTALQYLETSSFSCLNYLVQHFESLETWRLTDCDLSVSNRYAHLLGTSIQAFENLLAKAHEYAITSERTHTSAAFEKPINPFNLDICFTVGADNTKPLKAAPRWWLEDTDAHFDRRMKVYEIGTILRTRGARLRIFAEKWDGNSSSVPPYYHGEPRPVQVLIYDSTRLWTFMDKNVRAWDEGRLPLRLVATCVACREAGSFCRNEGYGSTCSACAGVSQACEYPPPRSPWVVSNVP